MASILNRRKKTKSDVALEQPAEAPPPAPQAVIQLDLDIAPTDPLLAYLYNNSGGALDLTRLHLDSPALEKLRQSGAMVIAPLVSQGELIGVINLGDRRSEQEYTSDDRKLLDDLTAQASPAVRVAQLVRQQRLEARERERIEQELKVARLIQQTLLPRDVPHLSGWDVAAYYQPAREVGGDFYDFLYFDDGRIGFVIGDVTDKGVPAALVMATTRTLLRVIGERLVTPGAVLERVNELLIDDIPPRMFVTCLYALLDPASGRLCFANAGHDLPFHRSAEDVREMRATGMPLGLLPGMGYEEKEITLAPGDTVFFYSDGLAEAHSPSGEMYGFPRVQNLLTGCETHDDLIVCSLDSLRQFTGAGWEQEDDVTLLSLHRAVGSDDSASAPDALSRSVPAGEWRTLAEIEIASQPGNERLAAEQVAAAVAEILPLARLERLKTAVAEATMNAMEHGNQYQPDVPVQIWVDESPAAVRVCIVDQGGGQFLGDAEAPDLEAKLAGLQSPRGWGLFLIQAMVDEMKVSSDDRHHTVELVMNRADGPDAAQGA
jgi:serine phosphatase RsbU (regulator of sigma subunit)/anti-sigma regulatory factor (Ser/Thr protein kinase)